MKGKPVPEKYRFQFNGDTASCSALADLFLAGWELTAFSIGDGYHWVHLQRWMQ